MSISRQHKQVAVRKQRLAPIRASAMPRLSAVAAPLDAPGLDYKFLADQNLVGVCVILLDGTIAFSNAKFADIVGHAPDDMLRRKLLNVVPSHERERIGAHLGARAMGAAGTNRFTTVVARSDGSTRTISVHACGMTYGGQPASLAFILDGADADSMRRDQQFASLIVEQSPIVLFQALAREGFPREFISNNVTRFGYTAAEAKAGLFRFPDYVHPDDRPGIVAKLRDLLENDEDLFEGDYRLITRDGSVRWVHDRTVAIRDESGAVRAYQGS